MVPVHCTIVPISNIASAVHAKDQYWFLLLVYTTFNLAQAIFLYTGFLNGIDKGLDEAAIIDGCGDIKLLTKVLLPVCKPIIATEAIFVFYLWIQRTDFLPDPDFQSDEIYRIQGNAKLYRKPHCGYGATVRICGNVYDSYDYHLHPVP